ncbi:hypothetical protein N040_10985 [Serratia marcescens EGD-HP20]|nr:hypothetical protein N040_10985 [Serratia marcescens EGD-HP20]
MAVRRAARATAQGNRCTIGRQMRHTTGNSTALRAG